MITNVIKFFIGLALGILICIGLVMTCFYDVVATAKSGELPYDNVTYMIHSYHKCEVEDKGTFLECPVCGKYFYKDNLNCCSQKCEDEYWEICDAWEDAQECIQEKQKFIEQHHKKFK